jgi:protein-disulfide isomerase
VIKELTKKYKDKLLFVFRNRLISGHQNARAAASFAEAAGLQGKYWEVYDAIYTAQSSWENLSGQERTDYFTSVLDKAGADSKKALTLVDSDQIKKKIAFDEALANKHGVTGTPTFILNGKNVSDTYVLDGKIVAKGTTNSAGTTAQVVWASTDDFDKLILQPALTEAGYL